MKVLHKEIEACDEICPYRIGMICKHPKIVDKESTIITIRLGKFFPDFCPLPDTEEK